MYWVWENPGLARERGPSAQSHPQAPRTTTIPLNATAATAEGNTPAKSPPTTKTTKGPPPVERTEEEKRQIRALRKRRKAENKRKRKELQKKELERARREQERLDSGAGTEERYASEGEKAAAMPMKEIAQTTAAMRARATAGAVDPQPGQDSTAEPTAQEAGTEQDASDSTSARESEHFSHLSSTQQPHERASMDLVQDTARRLRSGPPSASPGRSLEPAQAMSPPYPPIAHSTTAALRARATGGGVESEEPVVNGASRKRKQPDASPSRSTASCTVATEQLSSTVAGSARASAPPPKRRQLDLETEIRLVKSLYGVVDSPANGHTHTNGHVHASVAPAVASPRDEQIAAFQSCLRFMEAEYLSMEKERDALRRERDAMRKEREDLASENTALRVHLAAMGVMPE